MIFGFVDFANVCLGLALEVFGLPSGSFWMYFSASILLLVGLLKILKDDLPQAQGLEKILPFGRLFLALPLAVFGTEHLTNAVGIASIVPRWMPWHLFWAYLVGVALIAAALSIAVKIQSALAATLLGIMFGLFVLFIHIPNIVAHLDNRIFWAVGLRDISFSGGALAYAGAHLSNRSRPAVSWLVTIGRFFIAIPALFFGVEHYLHPASAPGVPLDKIIPEWVPARLLWAYLAGTVLLASGVALLLNKKARTAATCLGLLIFLLVLFVYVPLLVASPTDIVALNYFADTLLYSGAVLLLADALKGSSTTG
jgi:uncharacterized membrane protein